MPSHKFCGSRDMNNLWCLDFNGKYLITLTCIFFSFFFFLLFSLEVEVFLLGSEIFQRDSPQTIQLLRLTFSFQKSIQSFRHASILSYFRISLSTIFLVS
ncbi:hypothetical protein RND81_04G021700 [Saponaria officinalis]|uniref:Uncharacterized protein n=1 Tax=Saponaria officinalis TaxID=3572 RepID=A0AAW1LGY8_SAPOF